MKIITLERRTLNGEAIEQEDFKNNTEDYRDWWCVIETEEEQLAYEDFLEHLGRYSSSPRNLLWNKMLIHAGRPLGLFWGDDDVYGYISPDEDVPEIGEEWPDGEGDIWVRID